MPGIVDISYLGSADVAEVLQEVYADQSDAVPDSNPLLAQFARTTKVDANGEGEVTFNVKLGTGTRVANLRDSGQLPRHDPAKTKKGKVKLSHLYAHIQLGGQALSMMRQEKGAWVDLLESEMADKEQAVKVDAERQMNGDGRGILCVIEAIAGAPNFDVMNPFGAQGAGPGTMLLLDGMDVDILQPNGTKRGTTTISVNIDNDRIAMNPAVAGVAIGDLVVRSNGQTGAGAENNFGIEVAGLLAAAGVGLFEGIDGATQQRWRGIRVDKAGGAITEYDTQLLSRRVKTASGRQPNLAYTTAGVSLAIQRDLAALRRFTGDTVSMKGGYSALKLGNDNVIEGDLCPKGHYFHLNTDSEVVGVLDAVKMGWIDKDGAKLSRIPGFHAYGASLWYPLGLVWRIRNATGVLVNGADDHTIRR